MKSALFQEIFIFREELSIPIFSYFTQYSQYILTGIVSKNTKCWFCRKWDTIGKFGIHFRTKISLFLFLMSQSADYLVLLVCKFIFLASRYIQFKKNWNLAQKSYSCWPFSVKLIQNGVFFINNGKICWNTQLATNGDWIFFRQSSTKYLRLIPYFYNITPNHK